MVGELFNPDFPQHIDNSWKYTGIPTIECVKNDILWAAWYGGLNGEAGDNYIVASRSFDNGKSWTQAVTAIRTCKHRAFDPCLWRCPDGRLWLFWGEAKGKLEDMQVWAAYSENPEAPQPKWSEPRYICPGVMVNKPIVLHNADWLLPVAFWDLLRTTQTDPSLASSRVWRSTDNGETFSFHGCADIEKSSCDEHMLVELEPNIIKMFTRTIYGIGESISNDGGATWSKGRDSGLYNADSRFFFGRLKSGNLLLVKHAPGKCSPKKVADKEQQIAYDGWSSRINLTACLSEDNGKTWPYEVLIDGRNYVSYPDATQDDNGIINIVYDRDRHKEQNIIIASLTEEDIKTKNKVNLTNIHSPNSEFICRLE